MKKLLLALLTAGIASTQAAVIEWTTSNDVGFGADALFHDGIYSGKISDVAYDDGGISISDWVVGKYAIINLNTNMFFLSTTNNPASTGAFLTASFGFDITAANFGTATGYTLTGVSVDVSSGSQALTEFAAAIAIAPAATYKFSFISPLGNGQVASVPEPTTIGLMGLGILGLAFGVRRRKV